MSDLTASSVTEAPVVSPAPAPTAADVVKAGGTALKLATSVGAATVTQGVAAIGKLSAAGFDVIKRASAGSKCPECGSIDVLRTDASGAVQDAYKCRKCSHEFNAIGPEGARKLVKVAKVGFMAVSWLTWTVIDSL